MRTLFFSILCCLPFLTFSQGSTPFITTWKTDNPGTSCNSCITIPTNAASGPYSYDIDWENDGIYDDFGATGDITHDYGTAGTYQVAIRGILPHIYMYDSGEELKLLSIDQWGDIIWNNMSQSFRDCINMHLNAMDNPDLTLVTSLAGMFSGVTSFNANLNTWDISNIIYLTGVFQNCTLFNGDISQWDVSNVKYFSSLFWGASSFNQDLSIWDVSSALDMSNMFFGASNFNSDIGNWDVSNVSNLAGMFRNANSFDQNLSSWQMPNVINLQFMFYGASNFNGDINNWDVSGVTSMRYMFTFASSFNRDISQWDVSNVLYMNSMFSGATSFNQDISTWNVTSTSNMRSMFSGATSFNQDLSNWNISSVSDMIGIFSYTNINQSNYDNILNNWSQQVVQNNVQFGVYGLTYCFGEEGRNSLINSHNWNVYGDTYSCPNISNDQIDNCYSGLSKEVSAALDNIDEDVHFYDSNDNIICTINANGNDLGLVNIDVFISSSSRSANIPYIDRDINISPEFQPTTPVSVRIYYTASELSALQAQDPSIIEVTDLDFTKTSVNCTGTYGGGGQLVLQSGSGDYFTNGDVYLLADVSSFSTFHAHGQNLALPVELIYFDARKQNNKALLTWSTATEVNNQGFAVQHSTTARLWENVGWLEGKNTSENTSDYLFIHDDPVPGNNYYRLNQIDYDGQYEYSEIRNVAFESNNNHEFYPNPASHTLYFSEVANFTISDLNGKTMISSRGVEADISSLASGVYFIKLDTQVKRFIKL